MGELRYDRRSSMLITRRRSLCNVAISCDIEIENQGDGKFMAVNIGHLELG